VLGGFAVLPVTEKITEAATTMTIERCLDPGVRYNYRKRKTTIS
jgi:hypothetical protein